MKSFLGSVLVLTAFLLANAVAAGIVLALGSAFLILAPGANSPWPWFLVCGLAALGAYHFLKWALRTLPRLLP